MKKAKILGDLAQVVREAYQAGFIAAVREKHAGIVAEIKQNAKDAARYRWLRDSDGAGGRIYCAMDQFEADGQCLATLLGGRVLDDAIDAAMREHGGAK